MELENLSNKKVGEEFVMRKKGLFLLIVLFLTSRIFSDDQLAQEVLENEPILADNSYEAIFSYIEDLDSYKNTLSSIDTSLLDFDITKKISNKKRVIDYRLRFLNDIPRPDSGSEVWKDLMLERGSNGSSYFHTIVFSYPGVLRGLFDYYYKVKDNPFLDLNLSSFVGDIFNEPVGYSTICFFNDYGKNISYGAENAIDDGFLENVKDVYNIILDQMDNFDVEDRDVKKLTIDYLLNDQIDERSLVENLHDLLCSYGGVIHKVRYLRNLNHSVNGLTIKYQGSVVDGILGGYPDFEYQLDYNEKKEVSFRKVQFLLHLLPGYSEETLIANGVLLGDNFYILSIDRKASYGYTDMSCDAEDLVRKGYCKACNKEYLGKTDFFTDYGVETIEILEKDQ